MFLGTVLIIGGIWWALDVRRRPHHSRSDFRGPVIMIVAGATWLGVFLYGLSLW
jgi:hypothetical protein